MQYSQSARIIALVILTAALGCSDDNAGPIGGSGGSAATGGSGGNGGIAAAGGSGGNGGIAAAGGSGGNGGSAAAGGNGGNGGSAAAGGSGGDAGAGGGAGTGGTGGDAGAGGSAGTGGTGGDAGAGGSAGTGGTGGDAGAGGGAGTGGTGGDAGAGGGAGTGGTGGDAGAGGGAGTGGTGGNAGTGGTGGMAGMPGTGGMAGMPGTGGMGGFPGTGGMGGFPGTGGIAGMGGMTGTGGGMPPVHPAPEFVLATVSCNLPLDLGQIAVDIEVDIHPRREWETGRKVKVDFEAEALLPASVGQLLLDLGSETLTIGNLLAELAVTGGTPSPISVTEDEAMTYDLDPNGDETADDVLIEIEVDSQKVNNDGSASVNFAVDHFVVVLKDLPILGDRTVSEDPEISDFDCELTSTTASFPVAD